MSGLSAPGTAAYYSGTQVVGDGTWDADRNDFLLPNIQGLNYPTMRYNGMGNRFAGNSFYKNLIIGHGVLAALTFLAVVPAAILVAAFYYRNPRLALRLHIGLQIFTVVLTIIIFILGAVAVGSARALTNPHHGIGVAILVLVLVQAIGGAIVHRIEKGKVRYYIPLKLMLHQWLGRAIALLAFAQIPIGLTLYGSPIYLFVLYALWMLALLIAFFYLVFSRHKRIGLGEDDRGSYLTGSQTDTSYDRRDKQRDDHQSGRFGALTGALAGGLGIEALRRRRKERRRQNQGNSRYSDLRTDGRSGVDSEYSEKYSQSGRQDPRRSWRDRFALRGRNNRKDDRQYKDQQGRYHGDASNPSTLGLSRMEEGRPTAAENDHWREVERREAEQAAADRRAEEQPALTSGPAPDRTNSGRNRLQKRRSRDSLQQGQPSQEQGREDDGPEVDASGLAALPLVGGYFYRRRQKKEQQRVEANRQREYETSRLYSQNYTPSQPDQRASLPPTSDINDFAQDPNRPRPIQAVNGAPPPFANLYTTPSDPTHAASLPPSQGQHLPPPPPPHSDPLPSSPSDVYISPNRTGQRLQSGASTTPYPRRGNSVRVHVAPGGPPAVVSIMDPTASTTSGNSELIAGQPVSVKVKVHPDGRHVTLRRVNAEEADQDRLQRQASQRRRRSDSIDTNDQRRNSYRRSSASGQTQQPTQTRVTVPYPQSQAPPSSYPVQQTNPPMSNPQASQPVTVPFPPSSSAPYPRHSQFDPGPANPYTTPAAATAAAYPSPTTQQNPYNQQQQQPQQTYPYPSTPLTDYPPPPPIPPPSAPDPPSIGGGGGGGVGGGAGGVGSPTAATSPAGAGYDTSDLSTYEANRRRRRQERAQAERQRLRSGTRVSFEQ